MKTEYCKVHEETKMRVIIYCPACRGADGGKASGQNMTAAQRKKRAKKAAAARWKKAAAK